jgi:hypothetical protein
MTKINNIKKTNVNEFFRSFEIKPNGAYNLFLGAGCSILAGIPSSSSLVWEFKKKIYCGQYKVNDEKFFDLESEVNRIEIQKLFDKKEGFPVLNSPNEYSFYFEKCYPLQMDRKFFIQSIIKNKKPTLGHLCLGTLIDSEKISEIYTTNFDELIENGLKSINESMSFIMISPDNSHQIDQIDNQVFPKIVKLHGDYRYDKLQNTSEELQNLDQKLRKHFLRINKSFGLVVIGYGGKDNSIMNVLEESLQYENPFPYGLLWCIKKGEKPTERVIKLINMASEKNKATGFLEIDNFDEFLYYLYKSCNLKNYKIEKIADNLFKKRQPFYFQQTNPKIPLIKLNAIKIDRYPNTVYSFDSNIQNWLELRDVIQGRNVVAALFKKKIFAFGEISDIKNAFSDRITSEIEIVDVNSKWLFKENSFFIGMLYDLIAISFINKYRLRSVGKKRKFYHPNKDINIRQLPIYINLYEALEIKLDFKKNCLWMLLFPTVVAIDSRDYSEFSPIKKKQAIYERQHIINQVLSKRYNNIFDDHLSNRLYYLKHFNKKSDSIIFSLGDFNIELDNKFVYGGYKFNDQDYFFQGVYVEDEPLLSFHLHEKNYRIIHPLKGLKYFGPYDYSFTNKDTISTIKIALISPKNDIERILVHLKGLSQNKHPSTESDYLIEYPGFSSVYKKYLEIPSNSEDKLCVLVEEKEAILKTHREFYEMLKRKIDYYDTLKGDFDLLLIYFPSKWAFFREKKTEDVYFDLHDSIKIYCAKKNIKVQFIEDKSINYQDQAKVRWGLSLATYVKANGIPWKNQVIDSNTIFIGIGYAIRRTNHNRIVIGCSQLFDSSGCGLRFLLQPIEKPIFYGKNPFMSKEDARRIVLKLREAYFKMNPNFKIHKLVIHKTTHFTHEEMEGIAEASEGIKKVELYQIQQNNLWRGIRVIKNENLVKAFYYPVLRGTSMQIDDFTFLLWTHGSIAHNDLAGANRNYYQGKRGIPAPLLIRRFRGNDPYEIVIKEILNLTKMNWNGCQLYKNIPVTLDFSKTLSEIAKQDELLNNIPYDFRFFM